MKKSLVIIFTLFLFTTILKAQTTEAINQSKYLSIGGIEQWVTIKGADKTKPIVLFVHGGPGSVMSPYQTIYREWEKDFVLVNWDQRGAGRTFGKNNPPTELNKTFLLNNPLTLKQMVADGIELTTYLTHNLGQKKVILMGTSWGSILGTKMVLKRPDLFHCYIGHSQFVNFKTNLNETYSKTFDIAEKAADREAINKLKELGKPPYSSAKYLGQLLRVVKKYERNNAIPAPVNWWEFTPEYKNELDAAHRFMGDDYSFIHFAGHEALEIRPMAEAINFTKNGFEFKIPVYIIQGEADILTPASLSKPYFDMITAPKKEYHLVSGAAHGHNQLIVDKQYEIAKTYLKH